MAGSDLPPETDAEREAELGKLFLRARRALNQGMIPQAESIAEQIQQMVPDTTSAEELAGDVSMARKRYSEARDHFLRALEIEPANTDAERKYGETVIILAQGTRLRERVEQIADDPERYKSEKKLPWLAAFYSVIPGLGQIYNRQYEKGMALVAAALILLSWILSQLVSYSGASLIADRGRPSGKLDVDRAQQVMDAWGPLTWALVSLAIAVYLAMLVYSILDAYRTCKQHVREADELGVEI